MKREQFFTLNSIPLENGCCIAIDTDSIIDFAVKNTGTPAERLGFERFSVIVDGQTTSMNNKNQLKKIIQTIRSGSRCRAFLNGGKGVTINFDID